LLNNNNIKRRFKKKKSIFRKLRFILRRKIKIFVNKFFKLKALKLVRLRKFIQVVQDNKNFLSLKRRRKRPFFFKKIKKKLKKIKKLFSTPYQAKRFLNFLKKRLSRYASKKFWLKRIWFKELITAVFSKLKKKRKESYKDFKHNRISLSNLFLFKNINKYFVDISNFTIRYRKEFMASPELKPYANTNTIQFSRTIKFLISSKKFVFKKKNKYYKKKKKLKMYVRRRIRRWKNFKKFNRFNYHRGIMGSNMFFLESKLKRNSFRPRWNIRNKLINSIGEMFVYKRIFFNGIFRHTDGLYKLFLRLLFFQKSKEKKFYSYFNRKFLRISKKKYFSNDRYDLDYKRYARFAEIKV